MFKLWRPLIAPGRYDAPTAMPPPGVQSAAYVIPKPTVDSKPKTDDSLSEKSPTKEVKPLEQSHDTAQIGETVAGARTRQVIGDTEETIGKLKGAQAQLAAQSSAVATSEKPFDAAAGAKEFAAKYGLSQTFVDQQLGWLAHEGILTKETLQRLTTVAEHHKGDPNAEAAITNQVRNQELLFNQYRGDGFQKFDDKTRGRVLDLMAKYEIPYDPGTIGKIADLAKAGKLTNDFLAGLEKAPRNFQGRDVVLAKLDAAEKDLVARDPLTSTEVLDKLAKDDDPNVRLAVAQNSHTSNETLAGMVAAAKPASEGALHLAAGKALAAREGVPVEIMRELAHDPDVRVRQVLAANEKAPPAALAALAGVQNAVVHEALLANHATPPAIKVAFARADELQAACERLLKDPRLDQNTKAQLQQEFKDMTDATPLDNGARELVLKKYEGIAQRGQLPLAERMQKILHSSSLGPAGRQKLNALLNRIPGSDTHAQQVIATKLEKLAKEGRLTEKSIDAVAAMVDQRIANRGKKSEKTDQAIIVEEFSRQADMRPVDNLTAQFGKAVEDYKKGGGRLTDSSSNYSTLDLGRHLFDHGSNFGDQSIPKAHETGKEYALKAAIEDEVKRSGHKLNPGDVLRLALKLNDGDIFKATLTAHNTLRALARGMENNYGEQDPSGKFGTKPDRAFFENYLEPIRENVTENSDHRKEVDSDDVFSREGGAWYHTFGTAVMAIKGGEAFASASVNAEEGFVKYNAWKSEQDGRDSSEREFDDTGVKLGATLSAKVRPLVPPPPPNF